MDDFLVPEFATRVFWTQETRPLTMPDDPPPASADVLIIGGGYAGLSAALTLAQAGRSVVICEAGAIGTGASSSSAGSLGNVPKAKLDMLIRRYGREAAHQIYTEAQIAREYVESLVDTLGIDCHLEHGPRFVGAHSKKAFERLQAALPSMRQVWGDVRQVEREHMAAEIGSTSLHGGIQIADSATLQPALFHFGLAQAAIDAGARLMQNQRVTGLRRAPGGFEVHTADLTLQARTVVLATNAETGIETLLGRRLRRRMTVVPAYALVTEKLPEGAMQKVMPRRGSFSDTYTLLHYMAPAGNSGRLVLSGRAGRGDGDLATKAVRILSHFRKHFPALQTVRATHCWGGNFAIPGDWIPHVGQEDGIHYILGCCGTGVPMSTYLGHKTALHILDAAGGDTAFRRPMPSLAYWPLNNWLLPLAARAYAARDRLFR